MDGVVCGAIRPGSVGGFPGCATGVNILDEASTQTGTQGTVQNIVVRNVQGIIRGPAVNIGATNWNNIYASGLFDDLPSATGKFLVTVSPLTGTTTGTNLSLTGLHPNVALAQGGVQIAANATVTGFNLSDVQYQAGSSTAADMLQVASGGTLNQANLSNFAITNANSCYRFLSSVSGFTAVNMQGSGISLANSCQNVQPNLILQNLTAGTSAVCPNGPNGQLVNSGCATGGSVVGLYQTGSGASLLQGWGPTSFTPTSKFQFFDATPTTGITNLDIIAGAGQATTNLQRWCDTQTCANPYGTVSTTAFNILLPAAISSSFTTVPVVQIQGPSGLTADLTQWITSSTVARVDHLGNATFLGMTLSSLSNSANPLCNPSGFITNIGCTNSASNPYPLVDITNYFPTAINVGAMMVACHADATVLPGWTCDATRAVQNASAVGTSWAISGGNLTISGMNNNVPAGEQVHIVFGTTTALTADYTIGSRTATTVVVPTGSGLVSGTETITMYPLKNTVDEFARSYNQNEKWPSGLVMYDQTPSTTLATPSAPGVSFAATGGSFPNTGQNVCATVNYRTGDGVSASSAETCISATGASPGVLTITGPSVCPTYAQGYDVNLTFSTVGTLDEKLQGNSACGQPLTFVRAVLYPSTTAMPTAATAVPAFILWNVNNPVMYADSGASGFTIHTGPAFAASNIIATGTKGRSTLANIKFYNFSHINMAGAACFDSAFFVGSVRYNLNCEATGGSSGVPAVAYKAYGTANDVGYYAPRFACQDTFCTDYQIVETPQTYNDSEGMGQFTLQSPTLIESGASTSTMMAASGIGFGGTTTVTGAGLSGIHLLGGSMEGQSSLGCASITDAQNVDFIGTKCTTGGAAFTGGSVGLSINSTAGAGATYTTNTINWIDPHFVGIAVPWQNNITGKSTTLASNNFPWSGDFHYGGGQNTTIETDTWTSRPVVSDSTNTAQQFITIGTSQGAEAFGVGTGTVPTASLPTNYVGIIGPPSGTPSYWLQLPSAAPSGGQVLSFATPSAVGGVSQSVGTWTSPSGSGTVTSIATTSPITGGTITTTGTIACATCATAAAALSANAILIGGAGQALSALGSLGTTTTVLHGNAAGAPTFGAVVLTTDVSGILPPANGGSGVNNTATHTLGTSNQNWATLGTGIVKNTTTTGAITDAGSADVIALWTGTCSSATFLRGDGVCAAASGSTTWDAIGNPAGNQALTMGANTTTWTWGTTGRGECGCRHTQRHHAFDRNRLSVAC